MLLLLTWIHAALAGAGVFVNLDQAHALIAAGATVLDARGAGPWADGHVPNSAPIAWQDTRSGWGRDGLMSDDDPRLARLFAQAGVSNDRAVIVVGAARQGWGEEGRIYWTLDQLGHSETYILDGGWTTWVASGGAISQATAPPTPGDFHPVRRHAGRATADTVASAISDPHVALWDSREPREYAGETPYREARGGHVPTAVGLHFATLMGADGRLLPEPELRALLSAHGLGPNQHVIAYCTGGVRSGFAYAVLRHLGYDSAANYDGSMWQWSADPSRPLESATP